MNSRNAGHNCLKQVNYPSDTQRRRRTNRRNRTWALERIINRCFLFRCLDFCCMPNPNALDDDDDFEDAEGTEVERTVVRYMPESIEKLLSITGFDKNELKTLYRNFKNECPTGVVNEEKFKSIYCQFFPNGDADMYAHYVFRAFDQQEEGHVNFEEFAIGLSSLLRGSLADRLHWTFRLYDINHDGFITKEEMTDILKSIYLMLGKFVEPAVTEESYIVHAEKIFTQLDQNQDGIVTMDEFCETCAKDESIIHSMAIFDKAM